MMHPSFSRDAAAFFCVKFETVYPDKMAYRPPRRGQLAEFPLLRISPQLYPSVCSYLGPAGLGALLDLNRRWRLRLREAAEIAGARWWGSRERARQICYNPGILFVSSSPTDVWDLMMTLCNMGRTRCINECTMDRISYGRNADDVWTHICSAYRQEYRLFDIVNQYIPTEYVDELCYAAVHDSINMVVRILRMHPKCRHKSKNQLRTMDAVYDCVCNLLGDIDIFIDNYDHYDRHERFAISPLNIHDALTALEIYGRPLTLIADHILHIATWDADCVKTGISSNWRFMGRDPGPPDTLPTVMPPQIGILLDMLESMRLWSMWTTRMRELVASIPPPPPAPAKDMLDEYIPD